MTNEVALWKQRILERKANGQTVADWCAEHNVTKGSYNYWRRQVVQAEGSFPKHTTNTGSDSGSVIFAKVNGAEPIQSALQITWQDVSIHLPSSQEAHLAAELIANLRRSC